VKEGSDAESMGMTSVNIRPAFEIDLGGTMNSCATVIKMLHHYLSLMKASSLFI
jgi:hypothetical protein